MERKPHNNLTQLSKERLQLLSYLLMQDGIETLQNKTIYPKQKRDKLPLSLAQTRLWFLDQLELGSYIYNMPAAYRLIGSLNIAALKQSLNEIIRRHEVLRTTFSSVDGQPSQEIAPHKSLTLPIIDLQEHPETERKAIAQQIATQEAQQPFNLAQEPLFRAKLLRLTEAEHVLLINMHHIVSDGWSFDIFFQELTALYTAFSTNKPSPLPELPIQYADFAHWQREWLQGEVLESQLNYWKQQLGGSLPILQLPTDYPRPPVQTYQGTYQSLELSKNLTEKLKALSQREGVTLFMTLLAAFKTLLYRYTGQEDIIICSSVAGRNCPETESLIGYFNNILPMRTDLSGNPNFRDLLGRVYRVALETYEHQDLPFQMLAEFPNLVRTPLSRAMFVLQNTSNHRLELPGITVSSLSVHNGTANFDLSMFMKEKGETLTGVLEYKTDLFEPDTITKMLRRFQTLLESIVANPNQHLLSMLLSTETEFHALPLISRSKVDSRVLSAADLKQESEKNFVAPRDELELQLTKIWEKVLGIQPISVKDNFFEQGGHSLLAVRLFAEIKKVFNNDLPLNVLFQAPTVELLASILRQQGWSLPWSSLVPIQPSGSKLPLFLIHPCSGEVLLYRVLAQHMSPDQPVYGLQAPGLDGEQTPYNRVEDMAAYYIKEIQIIQPKGPYFLGGVHIGALVAFEMAQQLQKQDQNVQLLALFDTRMRNISHREWVARNFGNFLHFGFEYIVNNVKGRISWIAGGIRRKIKRIKAINYKSFLERQRHSFYQHFLPQNLKKFIVQEFISDAFANYVPQVYTGQGVIFRAIDSAESQGVDRESKMGWGKLFSGRLEMHDLPGDHYSIFSEPDVKVLAEKLSVCLEQAQVDVSETPILGYKKLGMEAESVTNVINQSPGTVSWSSLVPIQTNGSKRPFFSIINVIGFLDLGRILGPDQPFYGLTLPALDDEIPNPYAVIEDIAAHCITELRVVQPEGPYLLGGLCFGAVVAFEMAQQLQIQGQEVALLVLLDPPSPFPSKFLSDSINRLVYHWHKFWQLSLAERLTYILEKANKLRARMLSQNRAIYNYQTQQSADQVSPTKSSYIPKPYQGSITLLLSSDTYLRLNPDRDPRLDWGLLATDGLNVHEVPGNHVTLLSEPYIQVLAEKLKTCIDRVQAAPSVCERENPEG